MVRLAHPEILGDTPSRVAFRRGVVQHLRIREKDPDPRDLRQEEGGPSTALAMVLSAESAVDGLKAPPSTSR